MKGRPLFGRSPLFGVSLNTSSIVFSIRAIASVRYREVVRSWEGPLWEVPLYTYKQVIHRLAIVSVSDSYILSCTNIAY